MSTDLAARAAELAKKMETNNPSAAPGKTVAERKRIPMTLPQQRLAVPEIPGYHTHWMRGTSERLAQAEAAGYEFVSPEEVQLTDLSLGGDASKTGSDDMGSRVSRVAGGGDVDGGGNAIRLYLMKQKLGWYLEDQKLLEARNDAVASTLMQNFRAGQVGGQAAGEQQGDVAQRYVDKARTKLPTMFTKKPPK